MGRWLALLFARARRLDLAVGEVTLTTRARGSNMTTPPISRGFRGRKRPDDSIPPARVPPGQHLTTDFPVLSAGPTPTPRLDTWRFTLQDDEAVIATWSWAEFAALPQTRVEVDIHCVTTWSKLDTHWAGVTIDSLLQAAGLSKPPAPFAMVHCDEATRRTCRSTTW